MEGFKSKSSLFFPPLVVFAWETQSGDQKNSSGGHVLAEGLATADY